MGGKKFMSNKDLKELEKMLKRLEDLKESLEGACNMPNFIKEAIEKGHKEEAKISVHKYADGRAETRVEGSTMGILIALAGLEKTVLNKINAPAGLFEVIKDTVGTKEV
jgi:hypothetical protein